MTRSKRREWVRLVLLCTAGAMMAAVMLLSLSGCYTQQKAAEQMDKAHSRYEIVAAGRCTSWYPVRIDTVMGPVIIRRDTTREPGQIVYVDCDSALRAANAGRKAGAGQTGAGKVGAKCPDQLTIHDSIDRPYYITKVDSAQVRKQELRADAEKKRADNNLIWARIFQGLTAILAIALFITIKHKT